MSELGKGKAGALEGAVVEPGSEGASQAGSNTRNGTSPKRVRTEIGQILGLRASTGDEGARHFCVVYLVRITFKYNAR